MKNISPSRYIGHESVSVSTDQINQFLAAHPITADNPTPRIAGTNGELHVIDPSETLDRVSMVIIARDCNAVLDADVTFETKRNACRAKVDTIVRMLNPELATEECIVYEKAEEVASEFMTEKALLYRNHGVSLDTLEAMENPADQLRADFKNYVEGAYDMPALQAEASTLLSGYIDQAHVRDFETMVDNETLDDPTRVNVFGAAVTSRLVTIG